MDKLKINTVKNSKLDGILNYGGYEVNKFPKNIEYVGPFKEWDGITIFTDECLDDEHSFIIDDINSKYKLCWIHEPRPLNLKQTQRYNNIERLIEKFDYVMTYDSLLLEKFPHKTLFTVDNGIWIKNEEIKIHPKSKFVSMIYSWKNWTEGHKLRHDISRCVEGINLYGSGANNEIEGKEIGLAEYRYSIIIENSSSEFYFTEKILDCFACGTIPIYWGCPNIGDFFNDKGIMAFSKIEDLEKIFDILSQPGHYEKMLPYVKENFDKVQKYNVYEDWIYNNIYKKILKL